jgi:hypothetical protein
MIIILPVSLMAQGTAAAMLRSNGVGVLVNRNPAPDSVALFSDDLIEIQKNAAARIEASGSSADINADTMIQFENNELVLDHGSLSVNTSRGMQVRVGCVTVTPANADQWTHYNVVDLDGKVTVSALKNDVNIDARSKNTQSVKDAAHSNRVTVREGEQKSREEKCGGADIRIPSGGLPAIGAAMNSPYAIATGIGIVGVVTCWALCRSGNPISPTGP